jgi:hypothetical protein
VHQVEDQPRLSYDARSTNHQDTNMLFYMKFRHTVNVDFLVCRMIQELKVKILGYDSIGHCEKHVYLNIMCLIVGRGSAVGIATRYGLDGQGIDSR